MIEDKIAFMYTGGIDTTYIASSLAEKYRKIHLLTFCNGVCIRTEASKVNYCILKVNSSEEKYERKILSVPMIFKFLREGIIKDIINYKSPLLFDLCCKLVMEAATVIYCKERGIEYVTDGNNPNIQGEIFLQ